VFAIDHHDGSCPYTELPSAKGVFFDAEAPFICQKDMYKKVDVRINELNLLVKELPNIC
jgi:hypothetical protein